MTHEAKNIDLNEVKELRRLTLERIDQSPDDYYEEDIELFKSSDAFCYKYILHQRDQNGKGDEINLAAIMAEQEFLWRKQNGVRDIQISPKMADLLRLGVMYPFGRDKYGSIAYAMISRKHIKSAELFAHQKRCVSFLIERIKSEKPNSRISVLMDCRDVRLQNVDFEMIKFLIFLLTKCYPQSIGNVYVYKMSIILNVAWNIIKHWLNPWLVERVKFVSNESLLEHFDIDQLQVEYGGTNNFIYNFDAQRSGDTLPPIDEMLKTATISAINGKSS